MHRKLDDYEPKSYENNDIGSVSKKIKTSSTIPNLPKVNKDGTSGTLTMNADKFTQNDILELTILSKLPSQVD